MLKSDDIKPEVMLNEFSSSLTMIRRTWMKRTTEAGSLVYPFDFDILVCMQPMNCSNSEE